MKKAKKKGLALALIALTMTVSGGVVAIANREAKAQSAFTQLDENYEAVEAAILKQGSSGDEVREVQRRLKLWGYYNGGVDGVFGAVRF